MILQGPYEGHEVLTLMTQRFLGYWFFALIGGLTGLFFQLSNL